ncbi:VOC family protein [Flavobacterium algicola]|uniref:VOC family protein n=1 Tax=Flavobacterium algicola TaxID=556529 RepID=UPI001EFDD204|nr:VOC family protein [Flavobacterium algicola]MCG9792954.1 VOC family protein [Flavobacterium algicola]
MKLRIARHTNDLEKISAFYTSILNLEVLGGFKNHDYYDGLFLGNSSFDWHLEFTKTTETTEFNYNDDDLLVFYPETLTEYQSIIDTITNNNIAFLTAKNPYWNQNGKVIEDPDGYKIVISNIKAV